jgi:hypothetical protein
MCQMYQLVSTIPDHSGADISDFESNDDEYRQEQPMTSATSLDISNLPPLEHRADWPESAANKICQSVEYCMQDEMLALGPASTVPPLMVVVESLKVV